MKKKEYVLEFAIGKEKTGIVERMTMRAADIPEAMEKAEKRIRKKRELGKEVKIEFLRVSFIDPNS